MKLECNYCGEVWDKPKYSYTPIECPKCKERKNIRQIETFDVYSKDVLVDDSFLNKRRK